MGVEMAVLESLVKVHFGPDRRQFLEGPSDRMRESTANFFDMTPVASDANLGRYKTKSWFGDNCLFTLPTVDTAAIRRTKAQAESGGHLVMIQRFLTGHLLGRLGDESVDRHTGEIYLVDLEYRYECLQFPAIIQSIFFPKSVLGYDSAKHAPFIHLSQHPTFAKLLGRQLDQIYRDLVAENTLNPIAQERFIACIKLAMGNDQKEADVRRQASLALKDLICQFIEHNLETTDLGVAQILREFGVSRASLYRMFESKGGVRQYISDRRLFRAVSEIAERPMVRGELTRISEKWGFSSDANFNRAVRRQFGVPPGALLGGTDAPTELIETTDTFGAGFATLLNMT